MTTALTDLGLLRGRQTITLLNGVSSVGAGSSYSDFSAMWRKTFQLTGAGTYTVAVQGSNDGTNWVDIATFTSPDLSSHQSSFVYLRGNVTAYTSGTITLTVTCNSE